MFTQLDWEFLWVLRPNCHKQLEPNTPNLIPWKGRVPAGELTINSQSVRAKKDYELGKSRSLRIVCIGDSVTFGLDVDDDSTYPAQLQQIVAAADPKANVEVINAGVPGYTSRQGLVFFYKRLLRFKPDIVVAEFGFNDAYSKGGWFTPSDSWLLEGNIQEGFRSKYSYRAIPLVMLHQPLFVYFKYLGVLVHYAKIKAAADEISKKDYAQNLNNANARTKQEMIKKFQNARVPPGVFLDDLNQMAQLARRNQFRLVFYLPFSIHPLYRFLVYTVANENGIPVVDFSGRQGGYDMEELSKNPAYDRILSLYRRNISDDFLKKNKIYLVTTDGVHPNAVGNRIVAEEIAAVLGFHPASMP